MTELITSLQNPRIKNILHLEKASVRREQNLFVIEGRKELQHACHAGFQISSLFYCPDILSEAEQEYYLKLCPASVQKFEISLQVYEKIAYRGSTEGILALAVPIFRKPAELKLKKDPLLLVLEAVEKPGNLGAILRSADGAGIDAVIICDPHTDLYNPNVIRSAVGCVFTVPTAICTSNQAWQFFRENGIRSYAAALTATTWFHDSDFREASAIVLGTESTGLSEFWLTKADKQIRIPMLGQNDSLNVSASAAVLAYEAQRQRGFQK